MTIIFGSIDFPVYDLLIVVSMLLVVGLVVMIVSLVYVLRELRKLQLLIKKEEKDIEEFETDISKLENFEKDSDIKVYIKKSLQKGFVWEQIKKTLVAQGWEEKKLEELKQSL